MRFAPRREVGIPVFPDTDRLLQCQELHAVSGVEHRLQSLNIVLTGDLRQKFPTLRRVKIDTIFHGPVAARNGASQSAEDAGYGRNRPGSRHGRTHEQECMADKKRVMGSRQRFVSCEIYDHKMLWVRGVDCGDGRLPDVARRAANSSAARFARLPEVVTFAASRHYCMPPILRGFP